MTEKRTKPALDVIAGRNAVKEAFVPPGLSRVFWWREARETAAWEILFSRRRPKEWP